MADIMSLLQSAYKANAPTAPASRSKYVAVDPKLYKGTWSGTYSDKKTFTFTISDVKGFHAKVKYQSDGTAQYQDVLIRDNAFRIGNTKFTLTAVGKAQIKNVVTDPATGTEYLDTAQALLA